MFMFLEMLTYHQTKPEDQEILIKEWNIYLFIIILRKRYQNNCGVEFVVYDKEYTYEAVDDDEYDK